MKRAVFFAILLLFASVIPLQAAQPCTITIDGYDSSSWMLYSADQLLAGDVTTNEQGEKILSNVTEGQSISLSNLSDCLVEIGEGLPSSPKQAAQTICQLDGERLRLLADTLAMNRSSWSLASYTNEKNSSLSRSYTNTITVPGPGYYLVTSSRYGQFATLGILTVVDGSTTISPKITSSPSLDMTLFDKQTHAQAKSADIEYGDTAVITASMVRSDDLYILDYYRNLTSPYSFKIPFQTGTGLEQVKLTLYTTPADTTGTVFVYGPSDLYAQDGSDVSISQSGFGDSLLTLARLSNSAPMPESLDDDLADSAYDAEETYYLSYDWNPAAKDEDNQTIYKAVLEMTVKTAPMSFDLANNWQDKQDWIDFNGVLVYATCPYPTKYSSTANVYDAVTIARQCLKVLKVDEDGNPLYGSAFTLTSSSNNGEFNDFYASQETSYDWNTGDEFCIFSGLSDNYTYTLTETTTPEGYNTAQPVTFSFDASQTADTNVQSDDSFTKYDLANTVSNVSSDAITFDAANNLLVITVKNEKGVVLPSTGASGTKRLAAAGSTLVVLGSLILVTNKRIKKMHL